MGQSGMTVRFEIHVHNAEEVPSVDRRSAVEPTPPALEVQAVRATETQDARR